MSQPVLKLCAHAEHIIGANVTGVRRASRKLPKHTASRAVINNFLLNSCGYYLASPAPSENCELETENWFLKATATLRLPVQTDVQAQRIQSSLRNKISSQFLVPSSQ